MTNITLIVIPGSGARQTSLNSSATVSDLACQENLHGRDIIIDGVGVPADQWATTPVPNGAEVFATGSVKGNNSSFTLIVIPGSGARQISMAGSTSTLTVAALVCQENLHGRDIIVDGRGVPPAEWETTTISSGNEVFATGSVKGNNGI